MEKRYVAREVAWILLDKSVSNADMEKGVKKSENHADAINGCSHRRGEVARSVVGPLL